MRGGYSSRASRCGLIGQLAKHALQALVLHMGDVVVGLGCQREQRPTPRAAGHDVGQQIVGAPLPPR